MRKLEYSAMTVKDLTKNLKILDIKFTRTKHPTIKDIEQTLKRGNSLILLYNYIQKMTLGVTMYLLTKIVMDISELTTQLEKVLTYYLKECWANGSEVLSVGAIADQLCGRLKDGDR